MAMRDALHTPPEQTPRIAREVSPGRRRNVQVMQVWLKPLKPRVQNAFGMEIADGLSDLSRNYSLQSMPT